MITTSVPGIPDNYALVSLGRVDSTNAEAVRCARAARESIRGNTVIWAKEQTGGRGRRGRNWASPPGNLYCSITVCPECPVALAAQVGYVAALAVHDLMSSRCRTSVPIHTKWPNDVLINGKKSSGILLESSTTLNGMVDWLVVGIGINIAQSPTDMPYAVTNLNAESDQPTSVEKALGHLITAFEHWYQAWITQGFDAIREPWLSKARGIGKEITVRLEKTELCGIFADINHDGALILHQKTGDQLITAGDVFFPVQP